ncbi:MAG: hypothetical protein ACOVP1_10215, partial [Bacteroidia bacterium]
FDELNSQLRHLESNFFPQKKENPDTYLRYNKLIKSNLPDSNILVLYKIDESIFGIDVSKRVIKVFGVIYDKSGKILDYRKLAWQEDKTCAALKFENSVFESKIYKRTWMKNEENLSPDNELKSTELTQVEKLKIENGKFITIN